MAEPWIEILTQQQLLARIRTEPSNSDLFAERLVDGRMTLRLEFMHCRYVRNEIYVLLSLGERIVGAAGIAVDFCDRSKLYINHLSVEKEHRRKGFAYLLLEAIYLRALEQRQQVCTSRFTELGEHLKPLHNELDLKYPQASSGLPAVKSSPGNAAKSF